LGALVRYKGRGVRVVRTGDTGPFGPRLILGFWMQKETAEIRKLSRAVIKTLAIIALIANP